MEMDSRDRSTILIHYYRAMVGRADVWRMRMDATTNWAIGATALWCGRDPGFEGAGELPATITSKPQRTMFRYSIMFQPQHML